MKTPLPSTQIINSSASWRIATSQVEAFISKQGGHLGPVTFRLGRSYIQPYSVAPWTHEKMKTPIPAMLRGLRGDFFCLPFGGNESPYRGESHPPHGQTANAKWRLQSITRTDEQTTGHLSLKTTIRSGRVDKYITLIDRHTAVYCRHVISGMSASMSLGHHAMLKFPDRPESGLISCSRFVYGQVYPGPFECPAQGGYSSLKAGASFKDLRRVPTAYGGRADISRYPARRGFEDLVQLISEPTLPFAWTAAVFPAERYVWFALKDPRVLRSTVLWMSNGGRHYEPWNGRHVNVMGLEEVTGYFHLGLAESVRPNHLSRMGYPTAVRLDKRKALTVNYIMGVARIPNGFGPVKRINAKTSGIVVMTGAGGHRIEIPLNLKFLHQ